MNLKFLIFLIRVGDEKVKKKSAVGMVIQDTDHCCPNRSGVMCKLPFGNLRLVKFYLNRFLSPLIFKLIESTPHTFSPIDCVFYTFISYWDKTDFKKVKVDGCPRNDSIEGFFNWRGDNGLKKCPDDILKEYTHF